MSVAIDPIEIMQRLAEPFPYDAVGWKPQTLTKDKKKAMAIAFIDARNVMDRLDKTVGVENWIDEYRQMDHGNIECRLSVRINSEWITKIDVGGPSDQKDDGDKMKAAYSDALKRAAVKFGIGRYLYELVGQWVEVDEWGKFTRQPTLPGWAIPKKDNQVTKQPAKLESVPVGGSVVAPVSGPEPCITKDEWQALQDRAKKVGVKPADLLAWIGVAKPGQITSAMLDKALDHLAKLEGVSKAMASQSTQQPAPMTPATGTVAQRLWRRIETCESVEQATEIKADIEAAEDDNDIDPDVADNMREACRKAAGEAMAKHAKR